MGACGVAPDAQHLGGFFERQAVGHLDGQRCLGRSQLKQLLRQAHRRVYFALGVADKHRHAGALLALGPLVRGNALHDQPPAEFAAGAADRHGLGQRDFGRVRMLQRIAHQAVELAVFIGVAGFKLLIDHAQAVLQIQNRLARRVGLNNQPVLVQDDHAHHHLRHGMVVERADFAVLVDRQVQIERALDVRNDQPAKIDV